MPIPVCEDFPEYTELYYKAWELARLHVKSIPGMPQDPYMDESLCDTQLWIWDSCFMAQFCKFARDVFPGVETLNNFYEVLYGNKVLPKIIPSDSEPAWTNAVPGKENDIYIHIADNPPLFAWCEYENALLSGDLEHLRDLLYHKRYLQKHYAWFDSLKEPSHPRGVFLPTYLVAEALGYRWEGGASGMDNTPRGRVTARDGRDRPNNPNMLWVDALCQQALSASAIAKLFALFNDAENVKIWEEEFRSKKALVNQYYWDGRDSFYYDIDANTHAFYRVMTVASFWAITAGIASKEQAAALIRRLEEPETLGGEIPLITLARNDGDYQPDGRYWRGGLWLPTAYAALKGMSAYGFHEEAHSVAHRILKHMLATYHEHEPHTIWECYSPEKHAPARSTSPDRLCRPDFCGWSALGPISVYIEYVLGFHHIDAFRRTIDWAKPQAFTGEIGIRQLCFGDIHTDITAKGNRCCVITDSPYTLTVNGKEYPAAPGRNEFIL